MSGPTNNPTPRDPKRDPGDQTAGTPKDVQEATTDPASLDGAVLKGLPADMNVDIEGPIRWRSMLSGLGGNGPIYISMGEDAASNSPDPADVDQRTAPPVDFKLARRYVRGQVDRLSEDRVDILANNYLSWEFAVAAARIERREKTRKVAPVDFDDARRYVRNELTADDAQSVRLACGKYDSWKNAVAAAEIELACIPESSTPPPQAEQKQSRRGGARASGPQTGGGEELDQLSSPLHSTIDQSKAPPIDFDFVRRASTPECEDWERKRLNYLTRRYAAWDRAAVAAVSEVAFSSLSGPIEWNVVRGFVRNELSDGDTMRVRMAREMSEAWDLAVEAAELELAAHGGK